jgi:hypothetical protein
MRCNALEFCPVGSGAEAFVYRLHLMVNFGFVMKYKWRLVGVVTKAAKQKLRSLGGIGI